MLGKAVRLAPFIGSVFGLTKGETRMKYATRHLTQDQERMILDRLNDSRIEAAVLLALYCGAKLGELMKVRQRDIDMTAGKVCFSGREIQLTREQSERLMRAVHALHDGFSFNIDVPIYAGHNARYISFLVRQYCARYGLEGVGLREMRHTAIIRWMKQGASMEQIQTMAGYADYTTAFQVYAGAR